ncbi:MAG TPA: hypothetical protein VF469_40795 [Kofleriaceae bacterium]
MLVGIGGLAASIGCGGVNHGGPPDAAADASPPPDSPPPDAAPAPRCDPSKPFGAPTPITEINSTSRDQGAELIDDLTIIFGSDRNNTTGLYMATRPSPTGPFGTPVAVAAINAAGKATGPTLTADGLTMYYALIAPGQTTGDMYVTTRPNKSAAFPAGTQVLGLNDPTFDDLDPFITADGSALYFDSARGGVALDLYVAVRQGNGPFGTPQPLTNLNTNVVDGHPVLSHDGLTIYWSSTRTDGGAVGLTDIWMASRPSTAGAFGAPVRVPELSSTAGESVSWISPDSCMVLLQSDRAVAGNQDIYQAVRPL